MKAFDAFDAAHRDTGALLEVLHDMFAESRAIEPSAESVARVLAMAQSRHEDVRSAVETMRERVTTQGRG